MGTRGGSSQGLSPSRTQHTDPKVVVNRVVNPAFVDWNQTDPLGMPGLSTQVLQHMAEDRAHALGYPGSAISVALSHVLKQYGESPDRVLDALPPHWEIAEVTVECVRGADPPIGVCEDPVDSAP